MNVRLFSIVSMAVVAALGCSSKRASRDDATVLKLRDDMASIPAGWFSQGCYRLVAATADANATFHDDLVRSFDVQRMLGCVGAEPPRRVWISSFEIDRFEVTRGEYEQCTAARVCERAANDYHALVNKSDDPALVTFQDAAAFCAWRGKRLPTNAEWEKSARGTDDRVYPWGDVRATCSRTNSDEPKRDGYGLNDALKCEDHTTIGRGHRHPAGASPYGVEDLIDNAPEWVSDWFVDHVAKRAVDVRVDNTELVSSDSRPTKPDERFWFSKSQAAAEPIVEYDWNSLRFAWADPSVIDPKGPTEPNERGVVPVHAIKGMEFGISGTAKRTLFTDPTGRSYAGIRCARSASGPQPPQVTAPRPGEFTLPFREPGFASSTAAKSAVAPQVAP